MLLTIRNHFILRPADPPTAAPATTAMPASTPTASVPVRSLLTLLATVMLSACAGAGEGIGYYWQSISGHLALMRAARPVAQIVADPAVAPALREKLQYVQVARAFAVSDLGLPDNGSYQSYAALDRSHVLWNVFAAPELSLQLIQWCFPVAGCVGYRGYYDEAAARHYAAGLAAQGHDVRVGGVPAYSTLGWFDDPLPSPVIEWPAAEIARLIFHELAHQVVYVKGDSTFNESFATAVERAGVARWLQHQEAQTGDPEPRLRYLAQSERREGFLALLLETRRELEQIYAGQVSVEQRRAAKQQAFERLRLAYRALRDGAWSGFAGYDQWFDQPLGNAHLAAVGAYNDRVPAFERLLASVNGDLPLFYSAVREIASLAAPERNERLDRLSIHSSHSPDPAAQSGEGALSRMALEHD